MYFIVLVSQSGFLFYDRRSLLRARQTADPIIPLEIQCAVSASLELKQFR